jgi:hypothetical protein
MTQRTDRMLQVPLKVRGDKTAALYLVPSFAAIRVFPVSLQQGKHQVHRRGRGRGGTGRTAGRAYHATGRDGERRQPPAARRPDLTAATVSWRAAAGALLQGRRISGHRERAQQEGVEDQSGVVRVLAEGAQPSDQEQQLAQRRFFLDRGEPLGRLQHGHARRVPGVVAGQRLAVGPDHLRLSDHVERTPRVQHQVDVRERLEPGPEPGLGPADALGHGPDPPAAAAKDRNDPIRLAQLLRPQHDPVIPV